MSVREVRASGAEALGLVTRLLQRARLAEPTGGMWEASDPQWWWRRVRASDDVEQHFWLDDDGPVAGVYLTSWNASWQCDPIVLPGVDVGPVWQRAWELAVEHVTGRLEVPVRADDVRLRALLEASGLVSGGDYATGWLDIADRPAVVAPADGFTIVDRTQRPGTRHPMWHRNGEDVGERLAQTSLYDPSLDLAVEAVDGEVVAYSLYWFDPVTRVGEIEPVRVEDDFWRRGLARAMVTEGIDRLAARGAERVVIGWGSEPAGTLYQGLGFVRTGMDPWYECVL